MSSDPSPTRHDSRQDSSGRAYKVSENHRDSFQHSQFRSSPYPYSIPDRPLIDRVTNEWLSNPKYKEPKNEKCYEDEYGQFMTDRDDTSPVFSCPGRFPRRVQRYLFLYCTFLLACYCTWKYWLSPALIQEEILDQSMVRANQMGYLFGMNSRPEFADMTQLHYLDSKLRPGASNGSPKRLVIVGDVHGCQEELLSLLKKVSFNEKADHLIFTGDMVFRGPDSAAVVNLARSYGASCVRGNHEDRTLLAYSSLHSNLLPLQGPDENPSRTDDDLNEESFSHGDYRHRTLAAQLDHDQIQWLQKCPVILHVGRIYGHDYVVAHAGLVPGLALERQDPFQVMNMRSIDLPTRVPSESRTGEPWDKVWNHFQSHTHPASQRTTVIYSHNSKHGLNMRKYSKGLDSNCVHGGKLSALTIDGRGRQKLYSVKCKDHPRAMNTSS